MKPLGTVEEIRNQFLNKEVTVYDYTRQVLDKLKEDNKEINAYISILEDQALERARALDEKLEKGEKPGALFGVPVSIKDNIAIKDTKMTCGSKMLENFYPPYQASLVDKILAEDAVIVGKTNLDEFAMGADTKTSYFGVTRNPLDPSRVAGGSSGGAGASVAMGSCVLAVGTDTGGSVRQPASLCGLVGMKPTYGSISRFGVATMANTFDQPGVIGNKVEDVQKLLSIMEGSDSKDATALGNESLGKMEDLDFKDMKIAIPKVYLEMDMDPEIKEGFLKILDALKAKGAKVDQVDTKSIIHGIVVYHILVNGEIAPNMSRYDGLRFGHRTEDYDSVDDLFTKSRSEGFGDEVKRRIMIGTHILSLDLAKEYYDKALKVRKGIIEDFNQIFKDYDVVLSPTYPVKAYKVEENLSPVDIYKADLCTVPVNLAGLPGLTIPYPVGDEGLYLGLQIVSDRFKDEKCLSYGKVLEGMMENDL